MEIDNLIRELKQGTCALVIGPEFHLTNSKNEESVSSLRDFLWDRNEPKLGSYLKEDGFFYLNNKDRFKDKKDIVYNIQNYYDAFGKNVEEHYIALARLPFYFILSLSPDELMRCAFDQIHKPYEYRYFAKGEYCNEKGEKKEIETDPTSKKPLIFNLLGSTENWESMVFTYDSLFEFFFYLFPLEKLSQKFKSAVLNASSFLFLGFRFDKWYLKLVFFLLQKIRSSKGGVENVAIFTGNADFANSKDFYSSELSFTFDDIKPGDFIKQLYEKAVSNHINFVAPDPTPDDKDAKWPLKILYFAAGPDAYTQLASDREYKNMEEIKLKSQRRDEYDLTGAFACTKQDLLDKIEENNPHFVVISAHGNPDGELLLVNDTGSADPLALEDAKSLFQFLTRRPSSNLRYLLLNCCNSTEIASNIQTYITNTIGMNGIIGVEASLSFSGGFFTSFLRERNFERSFDYGIQCIKNGNFDKYLQTPQRFTQDRKKIKV